MYPILNFLLVWRCASRPSHNIPDILGIPESFFWRALSHNPTTPVNTGWDNSRTEEWLLFTLFCLYLDNSIWWIKTNLLDSTRVAATLLSPDDTVNTNSNFRISNVSSQLSKVREFFSLTSNSAEYLFMTRSFISSQTWNYRARDSVNELSLIIIVNC
jgi:hypothetical protein